VAGARRSARRRNRLSLSGCSTSILSGQSGHATALVRERSRLVVDGGPPSRLPAAAVIATSARTDTKLRRGRRGNAVMTTRQQQAARVNLPMAEAALPALQARPSYRPLQVPQEVAPRHRQGASVGTRIGSSPHSHIPMMESWAQRISPRRPGLRFRERSSPRPGERLRLEARQR
jgi:hypothetical protein